LHYAQARGNFTNSLVNDGHKNLTRKAFEAQKKRDAPAIIFTFTTEDEKVCASTAHALTASGVSVIEKGETYMYAFPYIIADVSGISWFTYNQ
jgi:hypothetical protein